MREACEFFGEMVPYTHPLDSAEASIYFLAKKYGDEMTIQAMKTVFGDRQAPIEFITQDESESFVYRVREEVRRIHRERMETDWIYRWEIECRGGDDFL